MGKMKYPMLSADDIAAALDLAEVEVDVPEWKSSVKIKAFTLDERDRVLSEATKPDGVIDGQKLVRLMVVNGVSEPKLTLEIVSKKSFAVIDRIAQDVMKLNGMLKEKGPSAATVADVTF
jgi:hypothetical protein